MLNCPVSLWSSPLYSLGYLSDCRRQACGLLFCGKRFSFSLFGITITCEPFHFFVRRLWYSWILQLFGFANRITPIHRLRLCVGALWSFRLSSSVSLLLLRCLHLCHGLFTDVLPKLPFQCVSKFEFLWDNIDSVPSSYFSLSCSFVQVYLMFDVIYESCSVPCHFINLL